MKLSAIGGLSSGGGGGGGYTLRLGNTFGDFFSTGFAIGVVNNNPVNCPANTWTTLVSQAGPGVITFLRLGSTDPVTTLHELKITIDGVEMLSGSASAGTINLTPITANTVSTGAAPIPIRFGTSFLVEYRSAKTHLVNVSRQILLTT